MEMEKAIVIFKPNNSGASFDLETPVNITANEFIYGVSQAFGLNIQKHIMGRANRRIKVNQLREE